MIKVSKDIIMNDIIHQIVEIANPDKIILFGSRAKGNARLDSDYDFLILKKFAKKRALQKKLYRTGLRTTFAVDMIANTPKGYENLKDKFYYVYYDIAKSGIVVYEKI